MKVKLLVVLTMLLSACNQDDEPAIVDTALEGDWVLSQVLCYCGFDPDTDFALTQINFDTERDLVTVTQNGEYTFFREAGEYFYGGQVDRIGFSDDSVYRFEVDESRLTLTFQDNPQIADDEVTYVFKR
ncbi:hypothetical protein [Maribacter sp. ACAM166]|uniref:hypothetical protein n=1 Tax=Maribacter sp. ACAM166 TaxID=2508996 RepID=UPI0010FD9813|nr:hypothetical protein [Maribacter sp. ACAM166]TLP82646.1 hypothetical protein ES765_00305 [Maribacter sp. ACAM166]